MKLGKIRAKLSTGQRITRGEMQALRDDKRRVKKKVARMRKKK